MVWQHHLGNLGLSAALGLWALPAAAADAGADAGRGLELIRASDKGNCSICHYVPGVGLPEEAQGTVGPSLAGIAGRMDHDRMMRQLLDPQALNPDSIMPSFGRVAGLIDVAPAYRGKPILSAEEIADVVAYLETLK